MHELTENLTLRDFLDARLPRISRHPPGFFSAQPVILLRPVFSSNVPNKSFQRTANAAAELGRSFHCFPSADFCSEIRLNNRLAATCFTAERAQCGGAHAATGYQATEFCLTGPALCGLIDAVR
jgi:hypothetical protein